jgi:hypothetical protein
MKIELWLRVVGVLLSVASASCSADSSRGANDPSGGGSAGSNPVGVGGNGSGGGHSTGAPTDFFKLLNATDTNGPELSGEQLIHDAAAIVRGNFVGVEDGRLVDYAEGSSFPIHMAVFKVAISEPLKGSADQFAYVEHIRGAVPVESFRNALPVQLPIILFLREASGWDAPVYAIEGDAKGRPEGATLYTYLTESGLVVDDAGLFYPLADSPRKPMFDPKVTTLDALARLISATQ